MAGLLLAFAAGLLTALACVPPAEQTPPPRLIWKTEQVEPASIIPEATCPVHLEWQAIDNPRESAKCYREAGDLYLEQADPDNAVRCYGNALDQGSPDTLEFASDDNWLLMAIKHARKKEAESCP